MTETQCPFDGKHFSSAARAACEVCNPTHKGVLPSERPASTSSKQRGKYSFSNYREALAAIRVVAHERHNSLSTTTGEKSDTAQIIARMAEEALDLLSPDETSQKQWRCFHCDELLTGEIDARAHFGSNEHSEPACRIKAPGEFALLQALRNAEDQLASYRAEDSDVLRAMWSMTSDHMQALRREEEKGYARGLADCRQVCTGKHGSQVPCVKSLPEEPSRCIHGRIVCEPCAQMAIRFHEKTIALAKEISERHTRINKLLYGPGATPGMMMGPMDSDAAHADRGRLLSMLTPAQRGAVEPTETPPDSDAEVFTRAVVAGVARWEFFTGSDDQGEVCVGGLRYATRLQIGVPALGTALREALERHTVWKQHPSPEKAPGNGALFDQLKDVWKGNALNVPRSALNELAALKLIEPSDQYGWAVTSMGRDIVGTVPGKLATGGKT